MGFDWGSFLLNLGKLAPVIVAGSIALANETGNVSTTTEASDALHLATGVAEALGSSDAGVVADASAASQVIGAVIAGIAASRTNAVAAKSVTGKRK